jgi:hypothetical protein
MIGQVEAARIAAQRIAARNGRSTTALRNAALFLGIRPPGPSGEDRNAGLFRL